MKSAALSLCPMLLLAACAADPMLDSEQARETTEFWNVQLLNVELREPAASPDEPHYNADDRPLIASLYLPIRVPQVTVPAEEYYDDPAGYVSFTSFTTEWVPPAAGDDRGYFLHRLAAPSDIGTIPSPKVSRYDEDDPPRLYFGGLDVSDPCDDCYPLETVPVGECDLSMVMSMPGKWDILNPAGCHTYVEELEEYPSDAEPPLYFHRYSLANTEIPALPYL